MEEFLEKSLMLRDKRINREVFRHLVTLFLSTTEEIKKIPSTEFTCNNITITYCSEKGGPDHKKTWSGEDLPRVKEIFFSEDEKFKFLRRIEWDVNTENDLRIAIDIKDERFSRVDFKVPLSMKNFVEKFEKIMNEMPNAIPSTGKEIFKKTFYFENRIISIDALQKIVGLLLTITEQLNKFPETEEFMRIKEEITITRYSTKEKNNKITQMYKDDFSAVNNALGVLDIDLLHSIEFTHFELADDSTRINMDITSLKSGYVRFSGPVPEGQLFQKEMNAILNKMPTIFSSSDTKIVSNSEPTINVVAFLLLLSLSYFSYFINKDLTMETLTYVVICVWTSKAIAAFIGNRLTDVLFGKKSLYTDNYCIFSNSGEEFAPIKKIKQFKRIFSPILGILVRLGIIAKLLWPIP